MKKYAIIMATAALFAACQEKETTVTNPPAENKETNTTIVKESPAAATKTETNTTINTSSPAPSP